MRSCNLLKNGGPQDDTHRLAVIVVDWHSQEIDELVRRALAEDVGSGDITTAATVPADRLASGRIIAKQNLVCAGLPLAGRVFCALDPGVRLDFVHTEGTLVQNGSELLRLTGKASAILTGERTALNFLSHLCGVATATRHFVEQLNGTRTRIRDTRKTTPGLRALEKYAVKMGGGVNHRFGLYDAILLKENHIAVAGGIRAALDKAHTYASNKAPASRAITAYEAVGFDPAAAGPGPISVQVEVRNEKELREALGAGAEAVLLDNMTPDEALRCVGLARVLRSDCVVEISGGITLENARAYADTGADFLSSGALTHSAPAADVSLLVEGIRDK